MNLVVLTLTTNHFNLVKKTIKTVTSVKAVKAVIAVKSVKSVKSTESVKTMHNNAKQCKHVPICANLCISMHVNASPCESMHNIEHRCKPVRVETYQCEPRQRRATHRHAVRLAEPSCFRAVVTDAAARARSRCSAPRPGPAVAVPAPAMSQEGREVAPRGTVAASMARAETSGPRHAAEDPEQRPPPVLPRAQIPLQSEHLYHCALHFVPLSTLQARYNNNKSSHNGDGHEFCSRLSLV